MRAFDKITVIRKLSGLTLIQKLILFVIASHLGKNEFCFLSLTTLQNETGIVKRSALTQHINDLIKMGIMWKLPPSDGYTSNRYGIDFKLLVTNGHQCSDLQSLGWSPTVTRVVTNGHPKRNIKENENKIKEMPFDFQDGKQKKEAAIKSIRQFCRSSRK